VVHGDGGIRVVDDGVGNLGLGDAAAGWLGLCGVTVARTGLEPDENSHFSLRDSLFTGTGRSSRMRLRPTIAAVTIALVLLLAGCTGFAGQSPPSDTGNPTADEMTVKLVDDEDDGPSKIAVTGSHAIEAAPDTAQVRLSIVASGPDSATVRDRLADNASALRQALVTDGPLTEDQLRSDRFRIRENRRARHEPDLDPYRGYHRFIITVDDTDTVEAVIDRAVEAASVEVNHVEFGLSDDRRAELRDDALEQALVDARSEAELLASTEGLSVGAPESMVTNRVHVQSHRSPVVMEAAGDAAGTPTSAPRTSIEEGDVTVSVSVHVTYAAVEPDE
jgi:uncharacterized protein YggE